MRTAFVIMLFLIFLGPNVHAADFSRSYCLASILYSGQASRLSEDVCGALREAETVISDLERKNDRLEQRIQEQETTIEMLESRLRSVELASKDHEDNLEFQRNFIAETGRLLISLKRVVDEREATKKARSGWTARGTANGKKLGNRR